MSVKDLKKDQLDKKRSPADTNPPKDTPKKGGIDIDDAQLDDVTDDSAFKKEEPQDEEITDENQRSESRVEPRRRI